MLWLRIKFLLYVIAVLPWMYGVFTFVYEYSLIISISFTLSLKHGIPHRLCLLKTYCIMKKNGMLYVLEKQYRVLAMTAHQGCHLKSSPFSMNNIDYSHLFTFSNNRTRSNGWKLDLKRFNTSQCGNFFTYKIAPIWNRLPAEAVNSASVEQFKIELDKVIHTLICFFFFFFFLRCLLGWTSKSLRHLSHCNSL